MLKHPTCVQVQFRYAFVCDEDGVKVLDVTDLAQPAAGRRSCRCADAHNIYLARTYAYVAGGHAGPGDPRHRRNPSSPMIDQVFNAGGCINDLHDVKLGITYASEFAYLADGKNGLRVVQLTSPETPGNARLQPAADAAADRHATRFPQGGHALAISEGARPRPGRRRDRATRSPSSAASAPGR